MHIVSPDLIHWFVDPSVDPPGVWHPPWMPWTWSTAFRSKHVKKSCGIPCKMPIGMYHLIFVYEILFLSLLSCVYFFWHVLWNTRLWMSHCYSLYLEKTPRNFPNNSTQPSEGGGFESSHRGLWVSLGCPNSTVWHVISCRKEMEPNGCQCVSEYLGFISNCCAIDSKLTVMYMDRNRCVLCESWSNYIRATVATVHG